MNIKQRFVICVLTMTVVFGVGWQVTLAKQAETIVTERYKNEKSSVKITVDAPDDITVTDEDYLTYLDEVFLSDDLTMPLYNLSDVADMKARATSKALAANERAVKEKILEERNKRKYSKARAKAKDKAKYKYSKVWHRPSEAMPLPKGVSGSTKTYMYYTAVTNRGSLQYRILNNEKAESDEYGFRKYDGYYCVAMGSFYGPVGTKYYITFSNGKTIRCIKGDAKSDSHTDKNNQYGSNNNDILEFIVDKNMRLPGGDISAIPGFEGSVKEIRRIKNSANAIFEELNGLDIVCSQ